MATTALKAAFGRLQLGLGARTRVNNPNPRPSQSPCQRVRHLPGTFRQRQAVRVKAQAVESTTAPQSESESLSTENGTSSEKKGRKRPGEAKGFVEEMRIKAMKLHTRGQAKDGQAQEKEEAQKPLPQWKPTVEGYIQFLVDSKAVYDTMEAIVDKAPHASYAEFRNTGLERTAALAKDLDYFRSEGYTIPEPSEAGLTYSKLLEELSESNPPAFICHFYNVYFAHSAGGRMIGRKVSDMILGGRELEFYKWDGELSELLDKVKLKINEVADHWSREEKDKCLQETELSFKYSGSLLKLLAST